MTTPIYQTVGATVTTGLFGTPTVNWGTHQDKDVGFLYVYQNGGTKQNPFVLGTPNGFVHIATVDTFSNGVGSLFWCRATSSSMAGPVLSSCTANTTSAWIVSYRNVYDGGTPYDWVQSLGQTGSGTFSVPCSATSGPNRLVIALGGSNAGAAAFSGWADTSLTGVTEDNEQAAGGMALAAASGTKAAASAVNNFTGNIALSADVVLFTLALIEYISTTPSYKKPRTPPWIRPGQFERVRQGTQARGAGVEAPNYPSPPAVRRLERPWQKPGQFARVQQATVAVPSTVITPIAPPTPPMYRRPEKPWEKPGFGRRTLGATQQAITFTPAPTYWGPHFPPRGDRSFWDGHFPEGLSNLVPPVNPPGASTFALVLESAAKVTYGWQTGLFKSYSGKERRSNVLRDPAQRFEGQAILVGNDTRAARTRLARYAALGVPFLLGLPYESLPIVADSQGTTVTVPTTTRADWAVPGGRVVVRRPRANGIGGVVFDTAEGTIQSVTSSTIVVGAAIGAAGQIGGEIMPAVAVFLDASQGFDRYQTPAAIERWNIRARMVNPGFMQSATYASLALGGTAIGVTLRAASSGSAGNAITVQAIGDLTGAQTPYVNVAGLVLTYHYRPNLDTVAQMLGALERADIVDVIGPRSTSVMTGADAFGPTALSGGIDAGPAPVGLGATVTTWAGVPVWDRRLVNQDTVTDAIQTFAQVQDLGGRPFIAGRTEVGDWGRDISAIGKIGSVEFQWVKKFLDTARGRWHSFWLPTWRADLVATASGAGTLTVSTGENSGDPLTWYPKQRTALQVVQVDGTITYARITSAVDGGAGTATLSIVDGSGAPITLSGSAIYMVSWLERVRFEDDAQPLSFKDFNFALQLTGRAVQQVAEATPIASLLYDESGVETSQPREGIEFRVNELRVFRMATGSRDETINGVTFPASPAQRDELRVAVLREGGDDLVVNLPASHELVTRYFAFPAPRQVLCDVWRKQVTSGAAETVWRGVVTSIAVDGHVARVQVRSRMAVSADRRIPTVTAGRSCPHILYDDNCKVDRNALTAQGTTTITGIVGRQVKVALTIPTNNLFRYGELVHVASGERMTIEEQVGSMLTLQLPINGLAMGDAVVIYQGCDHLIATCDGTFSNRDNFGGFPDLPIRNPFKNAKLGTGVVEQS